MLGASAFGASLKTAAQHRKTLGRKTLKVGMGGRIRSLFLENSVTLLAKRLCRGGFAGTFGCAAKKYVAVNTGDDNGHAGRRSEEHTSELLSPCNLVCRL